METEHLHLIWTQSLYFFPSSTDRTKQPLIGLTTILNDNEPTDHTRRRDFLSEMETDESQIQMNYFFSTTKPTSILNTLFELK